MAINKYKLRKWSVMVRFRDRHKGCAICGTKHRLDAHHINSKRYFPELAYELENGISLCGNRTKKGNRCHTVFHTMFKQSHRHKCTTEDWERFIELVEWCRAI